jgi:DTW domain-containing protein
MPIARDSIVKPGGELWVLHPLGEALPKGPLPENLQVLLLDGSWREAARMRQMVEPWGRAISLPMSGESRYRLRGQQGDSMHSTIEALMFLLNAVGLTEQERVMRIQFELHVYAGLRTRGAKILADEYIENSILKEAVPELLADLNRRRPNAEASGTPPVRKPKEPAAEELGNACND